MRSFLLSIMLLGFVSLTNAQVKTNFNNREQITAQGKFSKNFRGKSPFTIPSRDIKTLLEKDASESASGQPKPFKIAEAVEVDIDVVKEADWVEEDEFAYAQFSVIAAGAKSVSANFDQFYLPKGTELYVYSENGEMITGPVTDAENNQNNFWGTWVYKGGKLTVDLRVPVVSKSLFRLHISSIAYGYKDLYVANFGESSACNVNVLCAAGNGWENERNSVAQILNGNSTQVFTGALINNTCNLNIPYLLTANHVFEATPDVGQWKFSFQAWSATCTPSQNANGITFNGSTLRARNAGSDFCLVELNQLPPANSGITFSGWSRANTASPSGVSITHPRGDVMKVATYNTTTTQQTFLGVNVWRANWAGGTVEPGSSGGPLYNNNRQIIGQVTGGNPSDICTTNDHAFFGRFDLSWTGGGTDATRLSNWLDPNNTGAMNTDTRGIGILGADLVCSTANYTFNGPPISWTSSNPNGLSIHPTTGAATRMNNFNGQVTITAALNGACGATNFTKNVKVGNYLPIGTSSYISNCSYGNFNILNTSLSAMCTANSTISFSYKISDPNYSNFVFTPVSVPSGASWTSSGGNLYVSVSAPPTQGSRTATIALNATGPCGPYTVNFTSTAVNVYWSGFSLSPNPSKEIVTVSMDNDNLSDNPSQNLIYGVTITDPYGTLGESFEYKAGVNSVNISVQDFNPGLYILSVFDGKTWTSQRLAIQK
jgi:lysyl endopeptidase